jgi:small ligand-binding sensory domain FIST
MSEKFVVASARGSDPDALVASLLAEINTPSRKANLGFLYVTDALANNVGEIVQRLRSSFDVQDWIGTVGMGICCAGSEIYDDPAIVIMLAQMADYQLFEMKNTAKSVNDALSSLALPHDVPGLAIVHGNPMQPEYLRLFQELTARLSSTFFVGGLSSPAGVAPQVVNGVTDAVISGALFKDSSRMIVGHTQGCTSLERSHVMTKCHRNIVMELDHRPALEVFKEDIGELLARDIEKTAGNIFAGFPVQNSDTNDYLVRNIMGIDPENSVMAIGDFVEEGDPIMFCRRDKKSAIDDMQRMLHDMRTRQSDSAKGALYFSCLARGRNQFGDDSAELKLIQHHLGDIPLVGFFANGEFFHNRLYGYTGVLTLFM